MWLEDSGVVDQDIELAIPVLELGHCAANRLLHREIQEQQVNDGCWAGCLDLGQGSFSTLLVPAPQDDGRVLLCQPLSRSFAESRVTACHEADFSVHIGLCHIFPPRAMWGSQAL